MKHKNIRWLSGLAALVLSIVVGCAGVPAQEMSDARQSIMAARAAGAAKHAQDSLGRAEKLLAEAEKALQDRDYHKARSDALSAKEEALRARRTALAIGAAKSGFQAVQYAGYAWRDTHGHTRKTEQHYEKRQIKPAKRQPKMADKSQSAQEEQYASASSRMAPNTPWSYEVVNRDSLGLIATKIDPIGNPLHWPQIYKTHADNIHDADLIYTGQAFIIKRGFSAEEVAQAIRHGMTRGDWSLEVGEGPDEVY